MDACQIKALDLTIPSVSSKRDIDVKRMTCFPFKLDKNCESWKSKHYHIFRDIYSGHFPLPLGGGDFVQIKKQGRI